MRGRLYTWRQQKPYARKKQKNGLKSLNLLEQHVRDYQGICNFYSLIIIAFKGKEYTGDTDFATVSAIKSSTIMYVHIEANVIRLLTYLLSSVTTPEKWDSMTRRWKDHKQLMSMIKLFVVMYNEWTLYGRILILPC